MSSSVMASAVVSSRSPSNSPSPTSSRGDQRDSQSPDSSKIDIPESQDPDQKIKKRIQNRVAQRTYRNRMKQRVQDLERQLCEMKTRHHQEQQQQQQQQQQQHQQHQQHYLSPDLIPGDGSISFSPGAGCLPPPIWQHHSTPNTMSPDMWSSISSTPDHQTYDASGVATSSFFPRNLPQHISYSRPVSHGQMHLASRSPMNQTPNIILQRDTEVHDTSPTIGIYGEENGMGFTSADQAHIDTGFAGDATAIGQGQSVDVSENGRFTQPLPFSAPWEGSPSMLSPISSRAGTAPHNTASPWGSVATVPTELSEDCMPSQSSSVEDRFEYVLECARRVGFDNFDTMAAQYYAGGFDPCSSLAMDQRVSRNRHLPALVSEIQENSADWSAWERRGYQDEVLKVAETICAAECREFRTWLGTVADPGTVSLAIIQQKLPNIWALLTSLASATPLQRQGDRSNLVLNSVKQLCGLGDGADPTTADS